MNSFVWIAGVNFDLSFAISIHHQLATSCLIHVDSLEGGALGSR